MSNDSTNNSLNNQPKKTVTTKCEGCGIEYEVPRSTYDASRRLGRQFLCKDCKKKKHEENLKKAYIPIDLKCEKCGSEFQLKQSRVNTIKREGRQFLCPKCMKELQAQRMTERNNSKTPEEKKAFYEHVSECRKDYWKNMDKDTFEKRMDVLNDGKRNWEKNKTPEEVARISRIHSESNIRRWNNKTDEEKERERQLARDRWANKSPEEKAAHAQRSVDMWANKSEEEYERTTKLMSEAKKEWWKNASPKLIKEMADKIRNSLSEYEASLTQEERRERSERKKEIWENTPEDQKIAKSEFIKEFMTNWWKNVSDEIKSERADQLKEGRINWENNLTDEERAKRSSLMSDRSKKWWESRTPEEKLARAELTSKIFKTWWANLDIESKAETVRSRLQSTYKNESNHRFEKMFKEAGISSQYHFESEVVTYNDRIVHSWDYGIHDQNGTLVAVVDLDGTYFHADVCDYDGIHSQEEYDERRGLTAPDDVIPIIIYENHMTECFEYMMKALLMGHNEYYERLFKLYRAMPFPEPKYREKELIKSYNMVSCMNCRDRYYQNLSVNTRLGDRVIYHFHPSIWHQALPGKISPYDAWYDDNVLKQHIEDHILYHTHLNKNKILQGFAMSPSAPRVRFMSPGKAKMIINQYLKDYVSIFDPNMGYGGRMLGTVSLAKKYVGICGNEVSYRENTDMVEFIQKYFKIDTEINPTGTEYPCMFTEVENDDQITEYMHKYKCGRYVFITTSTEKYNMYVVDEITTKVYDDTKVEYVLVIDR